MIKPSGYNSEYTETKSVESISGCMHNENNHVIVDNLNVEKYNIMIGNWEGFKVVPKKINQIDMKNNKWRRKEIRYSIKDVQSVVNKKVVDKKLQTEKLKEYVFNTANELGARYILQNTNGTFYIKYYDNSAIIEDEIKELQIQIKQCEVKHSKAYSRIWIINNINKAYCYEPHCNIMIPDDKSFCPLHIKCEYILDNNKKCGILCKSRKSGKIGDYTRKLCYKHIV